MCDPCCPPSCCPMPYEPMCCPSPCEPMCCPSPCEPICCPPPSCFSPCDPCCRPKRCRSRELKSSVLITQCECIKRNGLQDNCPRTECNGRPLCMTKPMASCCPSKYSYRYANVTMGKPSNPARSKGCPKSDGTCNPCVVGCPLPACCQEC